MIQRPSAALAGGLVSVLLYDQMSAFELGIVTEVFGLARPELGIDWYQLAICSERPGRVPIIGGAWIHTNCGLDVLASAQTVIVPGVRDVHGDCSDELIAALRLARQRGARLVSICSGAFALAAAGLLDGRRATTHWQYADLLAQRFPLVEVAPEVLLHRRWRRVDERGQRGWTGSVRSSDTRGLRTERRQRRRPAVGDHSAPCRWPGSIH